MVAKNEVHPEVVVWNVQTLHPPTPEPEVAVYMAASLFHGWELLQTTPPGKNLQKGCNFQILYSKIDLTIKYMGTFSLPTL